MGSDSVVDAARQSLGPVGVYLPIPFTSTPPVSPQREAVGAHLAAGADHVILLPPADGGGADLMTGVGQLEHLAPALPLPG
jgi:hypothetical protein